jgi:hypothetical protein
MKKFILLFVLTLIFGLSPQITHAANAASLQFSPDSLNISSGQTGDLKVNIDATGEQVRATDIYVLYDSTLLDVSSVSSGTFFPNVQNNTSTPGKLFIGAGDPSPGSYKTNTGTIATITFKAKGDGTSNVVFDCVTGETSESNIYKNDLNSTDIIDCTKNNKATITSGASAGSGSTNPTAVPTTPSSEPSVLPQTGALDSINQLALPGAMLLIIGSIIKFVIFKS